MARCNETFKKRLKKNLARGRRRKFNPQGKTGLQKSAFKNRRNQRKKSHGAKK
jgi:hypothetical protein